MKREDPRISINKLGEYLTCSAPRRRRIIEDARNPKDFIGPRYNDFYSVAPEYMTSVPLDDNIIASAIDRIAARPQGTEWDEQNRTLNIDLLTNLLDIPDLLPLDDITITEMPNSQKELIVEGVSISVRPELLLSGCIRGRKIIGAIKFYLPKSFPLEKQTAEYIATTVHEHLTSFSSTCGDVDYRYCFVADIPSRVVHAAPRSYARRRSDIAAACEEIAVRWPTL